MAATGDKSENINVSNSILSLHDMFRIVGDQLSVDDVRFLKAIYPDVFSEKLSRKIYDGYTFLLAMEKHNQIDESNFHHLLCLLRIITRDDLMPYVTLRKIMPVTSDPVCDYLEHDGKCGIIIPFEKKSSAAVTDVVLPTAHCCSSSICRYVRQAATGLCRQTQGSTNSSPPPHAKSKRLQRKRKMCESDSQPTPKQKVTCDIRLRVRAEYCHHNSALDGNVHSDKPDLTERQFEKFMQANTILKARDLGSIMCDIKFCELTYLDAFWRDYINGSLLIALKGVFITETLKQAVGHEAIKLLVNIDEDDYEVGRRLLLENLKD